MSKVHKTNSHHDDWSLHNAAILQREYELVIMALDAWDIGFIDIWHHMFLEPEAIFNKSLNRHRIAGFILRRLRKEARKRILTFRVRNVSGPPMRTQAHSFRHIVAPE